MSTPYDYCENCIFWDKEKSGKTEPGKLDGFWCLVHKAYSIARGWCGDHSLNVLADNWQNSEPMKYEKAVNKALREMKSNG